MLSVNPEKLKETTARIRATGEDIHEIKEIGKEHGWKYLGAGATRAVFAINRWYIIKIEYSNQFSGQTKREVRLLQNIKTTYPEIAHFFLQPIVWDTEKFLWVVFPRALPARRLKDEDGYESHTDELLIGNANSELRSAGYRLSDGHYNNWGFYLGKVVILDAGFGLEKT